MIGQRCRHKGKASDVRPSANRKTATASFYELEPLDPNALTGTFSFQDAIAVSWIACKNLSPYFASLRSPTSTKMAGQIFL